MNAEVFRFAAGLQAQHVPFKGTPEALNEAMAGRIDWFFAPMVSALSLVQSGKLKALAVGTAKRSDVLPQLPTTVEAGVPGSEYLFWVGLFAPAKTPAASSRSCTTRWRDHELGGHEGAPRQTAPSPSSRPPPSTSSSSTRRRSRSDRARGRNQGELGSWHEVAWSDGRAVASASWPSGREIRPRICIWSSHD
jgi:hypothetical protein